MFQALVGQRVEVNNKITNKAKRRSNAKQITRFKAPERAPERSRRDDRRRDEASRASSQRVRRKRTLSHSDLRMARTVCLVAERLNLHCAYSGLGRSKESQAKVGLESNAGKHYSFKKAALVRMTGGRRMRTSMESIQRAVVLLDSGHAHSGCERAAAFPPRQTSIATTSLKKNYVETYLHILTYSILLFIAGTCAGDQSGCSLGNAEEGRKSAAKRKEEAILACSDFGLPFMPVRMQRGRKSLNRSRRRRLRLGSMLTKMTTKSSLWPGRQPNRRRI